MIRHSSKFVRVATLFSVAAGVLIAAAGCENSTIVTCAPAPPSTTAAANHAVTEPDIASRAALARAAQWLWRQQGEDGGWHSPNYAVLRSGQAYTPFALHLLLQVPAEVCPTPQGAVNRALDFIRRHINGDGVIGLADPDILEYPNYSTAYALRCLVLAGQDKDRDLIQRMRRYLIRQQYREANGFETESPAYGGWGFGGTRSSGDPGHMDLAHTRRVLQALRDSAAWADEPDADAAMFRRAERFLRLVQKHPDETRPHPVPIDAEPPRPTPFDGGFFFSPIVIAANKGRTEPATEQAPAHFRSYATTTCDGLLALLAAGEARNDARVQAAAEWLRRHHELDYPPGIPREHPEPWGDALHFYHLAVRAETNSALDEPGTWQSEIERLLVEAQQPDGSFRNTVSPLMKEDDPILATTLAASALRSSLRLESE